MAKQLYVAGLFIDLDYKKIALIRKNRPEWQKGKLNAIGGKIERAETPCKAMAREFKEETGVVHDVWREFCILKNPKFIVYFFIGYGKFKSIKDMTDEKIEIIELKDIPQRIDLIPNLKWLIPLALDKDHVNAEVEDLSESK